MKEHKIRSVFFAVALADLCYFFWCIVTGEPVAAFAKLIGPLFIVAAVLIKRFEAQNLS